MNGKFQSIMRFYDKNSRRLVYLGQSATADDWDQKWLASDIKAQIMFSRNRFVVSVTRQFLHRGSNILEGGCGIGDKVHSLINAGFNAVGLDFAEQTVRSAAEAAPSLPLIAGDVRNLPFPDACFDGYWSLGVIEHFLNGYRETANEMRRVLKPSGYLFLTFPSMSAIRKLKAKLGIYSDLELKQGWTQNFYQYALNPAEVGSFMNSLGLSLVLRRRFDALNGMASELGFLSSMIRRLSARTGFFYKAARKVIDVLFSRLFGHSSLLVFQKK